MWNKYLLPIFCQAGGQPDRKLADFLYNFPKKSRIWIIPEQRGGWNRKSGRSWGAKKKNSFNENSRQSCLYSNAKIPMHNNSGDTFLFKLIFSRWWIKEQAMARLKEEGEHFKPLQSTRGHFLSFIRSGRFFFFISGRSDIKFKSGFALSVT